MRVVRIAAVSMLFATALFAGTTPAAASHEDVCVSGSGSWFFILGALTPARDPLTPGSGYDFSFYACERTNGSSDCWIFSSDGTSVYQYDPGDGGWDYVEFWYKGHMPMAAGTDSEGNVICSADTILAEARVSIGVGVMTIRGTNSPSSDIWCYVGSC